MSLSISKSVSESVSISDSAKSASIVTDSVGHIWDFSNEEILKVADDGSGNTVLTMTSNITFNVPGVSFAGVGKPAFLATRS